MGSGVFFGQLDNTVVTLQTKTIQAVYRDGQIHPLEPLELPEGTSLRIVLDVPVAAGEPDQHLTPKAAGWDTVRVPRLLPPTATDAGFCTKRQAPYTWFCCQSPRSGGYARATIHTARADK